jgi:sugar lactone lactonase YvrE
MTGRVRSTGPGPRRAGSVVALCSALLLPAVGTPADRATQLPTFLRTIGGPNHAEMYPSGLEIGAAGSVVVADTGNDAVEKYSAAGVRRWRIGGHGKTDVGMEQPRDVAIGPGGEIFVADTMRRRIGMISPSGVWRGAFTGPPSDPMGTPMGVTERGDRVYVSDAGKNVVRVFDTNGVQLRVIASNGACSTLAARDADADGKGNVYVASYAENMISVFAPDGSCLRTWGSTGTGPGEFRAPYGVRLGRDPKLGTMRVFVADANNNRIQVFSRDGTYLTQFGSEGEAGQPGTFSDLRRVAVGPEGDVWGADLWGWRVERFDPQHGGGYAFSQSIGAPLPPSTNSAVFHEPRQVAFLSDGTLVIVDTVHQSVVLMTPKGKLLWRCGIRGFVLGEFNWPQAVAVDRATDQLWVADTKAYRVQLATPDCDPLASFGSMGTEPTQFRWIKGIAIRNADRVALVVDTQNDRVKTYAVASRTLLDVFGSGGSGVGRFDEPVGATVSPNGEVYVADTGNDRIVELAVSPTGAISWVRSISGFAAPEGVAVDAAGRIYVAETGADRVAVLDPDGTRTGMLGGFNAPSSVAIGPDGRLYVSDTDHDRIAVYAIA